MIGGMTSGLDALTFSQQQGLRVSPRSSPARAYLIPYGVDQVRMLSGTRQVFLQQSPQGEESCDNEDGVLAKSVPVPSPVTLPLLTFVLR